MQVVFRSFILDSISFPTMFLLEVFFCIFMQHYLVSVNTNRMGSVGVKLFVYFSFVLYTDFPSSGRI